MSFINDAKDAVSSLVSRMKSVTGSDLATLLDGGRDILAQLSVDNAASKVNRSIGSQKLRRYIKALGSNESASFTDAELRSIAAEINFMNGVTVTAQKGADPVIVNKGLEYAAWFKHAPLLGNYRITGNVGSRKAPTAGASTQHKGIDLAIPVGYRVYSVGDGRVELAGWQDPSNHKRGFGLRVRIVHDNGYKTVYAHMSRVDVKQGQRVSAGTVLGLSGNTGTSTGPHLHFEVHDKSQRVMDPRQYLNALNQRKTNESKVSDMLNSNPNDWANKIYQRVLTHGSADVRASFRGPADVTRMLELEGGLVNGRMVLDARNGSFVGPLQMGLAAWKDGPAKYSSVNVNSTADLVRLNNAKAKGGPGDLDVMAPGAVEFWNACWRYFTGVARNKGRTAADIAKVPRNPDMMYFLHNQGPGNAQRIFTHNSPTDTGQSVLAQQVGRRVRQLYVSA